MSDLAGGLASAANAAPAAPASTPEPSAPSTPATPAASSPAPVSLADHFREIESEPASAAPQEPAIEQPAPATVEPTPVDVSAEKKPGEPPQERWPAILENARKKANEEALTQFQQQYGGDVQFSQRFKSDPIGTITQLVGELQQHPEYGPQLRSHAAKVLGQRAPKVEPEPQPDLVGRDANGQEVTFYSAEQNRKWQQWQSNQMRQQLTQEFAPVMEVARERQQEREKREYVAQATEAYRPAVEEVMEMPGFKEHRAEIVDRQKQLFDEAVKAGQKNIDPMRYVLRAYREIVPAKLQQQQQQQLATSALAKAAGRDANPASVVASPPSPPKSLTDAFSQVGLR